MALNSLAPGFMKLYYATISGAISIPHTAVLPVIPAFIGGDASTLEVRDGGAAIGGQAAIDGLVAVLKPCVNALVSFLYAELWTQTDADADPLFQALYPIGEVGTNASATVYLATQAVITGRTDAGGQFRQYLMGAATPSNLVLNPPAFDGGGFEDWANYVIAPDTWIAGRDGGFASSIKRVLTKTNDSLRRKFAL